MLRLSLQRRQWPARGVGCRQAAVTRLLPLRRTLLHSRLRASPSEDMDTQMIQAQRQFDQDLQDMIRKQERIYAEMGEAFRRASQVQQRMDTEMDAAIRDARREQQVDRETDRAFRKVQHPGVKIQWGEVSTPSTYR